MSIALRRDWGAILAHAASLVFGYTYLITLRQLHYLLVSSGVGGYTNVETCYKRLSSLTAAGRRAGTFPALLDQTREIYVESNWDSPSDALDAIASQYRRDRTEGQDWLIVLGGEKATLLAQLRQWFGDLGSPVVLLRGYGSQTYVDDVTNYVDRDGRKSVLIYAGDFDPSGEDILRDFLDRGPQFDEVEHIAVRDSQIIPFGLIENPGKATDSRAAGFVARHGKLVQVEVEAIDPATLQGLYRTAIDHWFDQDVYDALILEETAEKARLREVSDRWDEVEDFLDN